MNLDGSLVLAGSDEALGDPLPQSVFVAPAAAALPRPGCRLGCWCAA